VTPPLATAARHSRWRWHWCTADSLRLSCHLMVYALELVVSPTRYARFLLLLLLLLLFGLTATRSLTQYHDVFSAPHAVLLAAQLQRERHSLLEQTCATLFQALAQRAAQGSGRLRAAGLLRVVERLLRTSTPVPRYMFHTAPTTTVQV